MWKPDKPPPKEKDRELLEDFIEDLLFEDDVDTSVKKSSLTEKHQSDAKRSTSITLEEAGEGVQDTSTSMAQTNNQSSDNNADGIRSTEVQSSSSSFMPPAAVTEVHPPELSPDNDFADPEHDERLEKVKELLSRMPRGEEALHVVETNSEVKIEPKPSVLKEELLETKLDTPANAKVETQVDVSTLAEVDLKQAESTEVVEETSARETTTKENIVKEKIFKESTQDSQAPSSDISEQTEQATESESIDFEGLERDVARAREMLGENFQTLVFEVGKLPLAVPLVKLGGIHVYSEEDITPMFGTPDWFRGILPSEEGNIMLVDTAKLIMPEKYEQIEKDLDYKYAILLDDTRWALACSEVREAKSLQLDDIRWAQKGSNKEWFAGMVVQFMCALLEVDALINLLYREGKGSKKKPPQNDDSKS